MRSDLDLQKDVLTRLELEPKIDAATLGVTVKDGVVTLKGNLENEQDRACTERALRFVDGVKGVVDDELQVESRKCCRPSDSELQTKAGEAIKWLTTVPSEGIRLTVCNGWLTLEGSVEAKHQSHSIEDVVSAIPGVRGVKNLLTVIGNCKAA
jgi:osmotically-inducible protein OsmY